MKFKPRLMGGGIIQILISFKGYFMGYIESNLLKGEEIVAKAKIH